MRYYLSPTHRERPERERATETERTERVLFASDTWQDDDDETFEGRTFEWFASRRSV